MSKNTTNQDKLIAAAPDLYQHVIEYLNLSERMKKSEDSEERENLLSIMVVLKREMKHTIERIKS